MSRESLSVWNVPVSAYHSSARLSPSFSGDSNSGCQSGSSSLRFLNALTCSGSRPTRWIWPCSLGNHSFFSAISFQDSTFTMVLPDGSESLKYVTCMGRVSSSPPTRAMS